MTDYKIIKKDDEFYIGYESFKQGAVVLVAKLLTEPTEVGMHVVERDGEYYSNHISGDDFTLALGEKSHENWLTINPFDYPVQVDWHQARYFLNVSKRRKQDNE